MAGVSDNPLPTKPKLHLKGGNILFAAPADPIEACFAAPALRAIRQARPHATLGILFPEPQRALWEKLGIPATLIAYPAKASAKHLLPLLQKDRIDWESMFLWEPGEVAKAAEKAAIRQRIGYPAKRLAGRLSEPIEIPVMPGPPEHRVRHYLRLVDKLGLPAFVPENFATPGVRGSERGIHLVVAPSSELGRNHEWPPERFAEALQQVRENYPEISITLLAGTSRPEPVRALAALLPEIEEIPCVETDDLGEIFDVLDSASLLFACDGLLPHLAAHIGLPTAVIFGPNEPAWKRPLGRQHTVLRHKVECAPCLMSKCSLDLRCQLELTVDEVAADVLAALKRLTSSDPA